MGVAEELLQCLPGLEAVHSHLVEHVGVSANAPGRITTLTVMSKLAESSWLLSLLNWRQVIPLLWAFSNFRRH